MNIRGAATSLSAMSNPIRICSLGDDTMSSKSYFITGLADYDVEVHVAFRVLDDATETHNYHAWIDGLPSYVARGASVLGAAEAVCGRFIKDAVDPEKMLADLATREQTRHMEAGMRYGTPDSIGSIAREEAYRAAAQIVHAAKVLAEPTETQKRLWAGMAQAYLGGDETCADDPPMAQVVK